LQIAAEDVHQRRFPGAVLADDGVNLAGAEAEVDPIERENAGEPPGHPGDFYDMRNSSHD
jgi:hypothetical protein